MTSSGDYKPAKQGISSRSNGAVFVEAGHAPVFEDSESD